MSTQAEKARQFLALHQSAPPLLLANAWDQGSARILGTLGFQALATTSSGHAATLGRLDGGVTRDEAIDHAAAIVAVTELPVSADLENGFAHEPDEVAVTVELALQAGLAGCSIEDYSGDPDDGVYDIRRATERVAAAVEVAHRGDVPLVLTARAENFIRGRPQLDDTIERLQAYQQAGADVLFAPGLSDLEDIRQVVASVDRPVNVLAIGKAPTVAELGSVGVARVSVGGAFAFAALAALVTAADELRDHGTYGYLTQTAAGAKAARAAFGD